MLFFSMSIYEWSTLILTFAGFVAIVVYVVKTWAIAKATHLHNEIITRPAISLMVTDVSTLDHIGVLFQNHTAIHANIRVKVEIVIINKLSDVTFKINSPIVSGDYNGENVWNISAMDEFTGHTHLERLKNRTFLPTEKVYLNITSESSQFDMNQYRPNPPRQYLWKDSAKKWIFNPVTKN